jgi:hypothetical protein
LQPTSGVLFSASHRGLQNFSVESIRQLQIGFAHLCKVFDDIEYAFPIAANPALANRLFSRQWIPATQGILDKLLRKAVGIGLLRPSDVERFPELATATNRYAMKPALGILAAGAEPYVVSLADHRSFAESICISDIRADLCRGRVRFVAVAAEKERISPSPICNAAAGRLAAA